MVRGIEIILQGRDPRDAWAFAQRICGVCTLVHGIASVRAVENALKYPIPANAQLIRNLMIVTQFVHDHVMHFYHLHALDWVDVVSALKADPKATSALAQSISSYARSSPGYFADVQARVRKLVESGTARHFRQCLLGSSRVQAAAGGEPDGPGALSRCARLAAPDRPAADHLRRQESAPELPGRRLAGRDQRALGSRDRHHRGQRGRPAEGGRRSSSRCAVRRPGLPAGHAGDRSYYKDWFKKGYGEGTGNFLTYGDFPAAAAARIRRPSWCRAARFWAGISHIHEVDLNAEEDIQEFVAHSWYDYAAARRPACIRTAARPA
jgi:hydrogenase large subunit